MEAENILTAENISISFGGIKAVDKVSFKVDEGEIVSIIGPNGAGKTTVFNLLTGVYNLDSGSVLFKGKEMVGLKPQAILKAGIARTFQNIRLFGDMRVIENVLVGKHTKINYKLFDRMFKTKRYRNEEDKAIAEALHILKTLNMYDKRNDYADSLPYGDQRKIEIARAIATGASLILLDEPAAGMNPQESEELLRFIKSLKSIGLTVLLIEHDMSVVMNLSDRIYVLDNGVLIASGQPDEVASNPEVIKAYLGGDIDA